MELGTVGDGENDFSGPYHGSSIAQRRRAPIKHTLYVIERRVVLPLGRRGAETMFFFFRPVTSWCTGSTDLS